MADPALVLFDDRTAREWRPLTLTRPAGELLFGAIAIRPRTERALGIHCLGHRTADALRGFDEPDAPPVLDASELPHDRDLIFLSSRAVLPLGRHPELDRTASLLAVGGEVCGRYVPAGEPLPSDDVLLDPAADTTADDLPTQTLPGRLLGPVWELVTRNAEQLADDIHGLFPEASAPDLPDGVHVLGSGPLIIGRGTTIEPGVVFDLREGPVWIADDATVRTASRIAGPTYVGPGSTLLGGPYEAASIGPVCKIRGEVEATIVLGYANKAHTGFLGHAYLGAWVNLGALTTNSDLKNNYGPVRLGTARGVVDTGEPKLGCLIGDHAKTAIGTLLNTGATVGAGANVFDAMPSPAYIPPFSWGADGDPASYDIDRFLETAERVMDRRDVTLGEGQRQLLRAAWERSRTEGEG